MSEHNNKINDHHYPRNNNFRMMSKDQIENYQSFDQSK